MPTGFKIFLLYSTESLDVALSASLQLLAQTSKECVDKLRSLGHLVFNLECCVVGEAQEPCSLVPKGDSLLQQRHVLVALVLVGNVQFPPDYGVVDQPECRNDIGVLERKSSFFCVVSLTLLETLNQIRGQAVQLGLGEPHAALLFIQVPLESDGQLTEALFDRFKAVSLLSSRYTKAHLDIRLLGLLKQALTFGVQLLLLVECCLHQLVHIFTHRGLYAEIVHLLLGGGRGIT